MIIPNQRIYIGYAYRIHYAEPNEPINLHTDCEQKLVEAGKAVYSE